MLTPPTFIACWFKSIRAPALQQFIAFCTISNFFFEKLLLFLLLLYNLLPFTTFTHFLFSFLDCLVLCCLSCSIQVPCLLCNLLSYSIEKIKKYILHYFLCLLFPKIRWQWQQQRISNGLTWSLKILVTDVLQDLLITAYFWSDQLINIFTQII